MAQWTSEKSEVTSYHRTNYHQPGVGSFLFYSIRLGSSMMRHQPPSSREHALGTVVPSYVINSTMHQKFIDMTKFAFVYLASAVIGCQALLLTTDYTIAHIGGLL